VVTRAEAEALAKKHSIPYYETSAKSGENLKDLFEGMCIEVEKLW